MKVEFECNFTLCFSLFIFFKQSLLTSDFAIYEAIRPSLVTELLNGQRFHGSCSLLKQV